MLFIRYGKCQGVKSNGILDQSVGPNDGLDGAVSKSLQDLPPSRLPQAPRKQGCMDAQRFQDLLHFFVMLLCKDFRWCHQTALIAIFSSFSKRQHSDSRLS